MDDGFGNPLEYYRPEDVLYQANLLRLRLRMRLKVILRKMAKPPKILQCPPALTLKVYLNSFVLLRKLYGRKPSCVTIVKYIISLGLVWPSY